MQLLDTPMQLIAAHLQLIAAPTHFHGKRDDVVVERGDGEGTEGREGIPTKPIGMVGICYRFVTNFDRYNGEK